ncbi:MAG: 1-deoxy-D-xylulose-5-phosphate reductoisomerase [Elusimicrobiota bacterium]
MSNQRQVVVLGSTGTIGKNTLDVISKNKNQFQVLALSAHQNVELLLNQIKEFMPRIVVISREVDAVLIRQKTKNLKNKPVILFGSTAIEKVASLKEADIVILGIVGAKALLPLIAAVKAGKQVGLANKEALIIAGQIIMDMAKKYKANIIPVDSEHSAIYQCLQGGQREDVARLILTASGGPFYRQTKRLHNISVKEALNHPTWKMGAKITIDSSTLMNKGLEAIEAHYLFGVPMDQISIVIHPQSIVHSLVEYHDGAMLAQLSIPDMRLPIQYALTFPNRIKTSVRSLKLEEVKELHFDKPDFSQFPCLKLALDAGKRGGTTPAALSASNEEAVHSFIQGKIRFTEISNIVGKVLKKHKMTVTPNLQDVLDTDQWARNEAQKIIQSLRN